jgi:hypothetical protein
VSHDRTEQFGRSYNLRMSDKNVVHIVKLGYKGPMYFDKPVENTS